MTIKRKTGLPSYETFTAEPGRSDRSTSTNSGQAQNRPEDSSRDLSTDVAMLAQRLGSERSWADSYAPRTPTDTELTPSEISGREDESVTLDENEPPPSYTEHATQRHELPAEPVMEGRGPTSTSVGPPSSESSPSAFNVETTSGQPRLLMSSRPDVRRFPVAPRPPSWLSSWQDRRASRKRSWARRCKVFAGLTISTVICTWLMLVQATQKPDTNLPLNDDKKPFIPGRRYSRHETSQSISGTFTLFDELDLSTTSGSIYVTLDLQPGDRPAVLRLSTTSGSIHVESSSNYMKSPYPQEEKQPLDRKTQTTITSSSGSVGGSLFLGNGGSVTINTQSGSISPAILTTRVGPADEISRLSTSSSSGSHRISVEPAPFSVGESISSLHASHRSHGSASLNLAYPSEWEGMVHASARGSGSVNVYGNGLQYQQNGQKDVYAWRGRNVGRKTTIEARVDGSGSINFDC